MIQKIIIFIGLLLLAIHSTVFAWDDCPSGEVNCTGKCGAFVDTNKDNLCDHSQPNPFALTPTPAAIVQQATEPAHDLITGQELKTKTVGEVAGIYSIDPQKYANEIGKYYGVTIKTTDSFQLLHDNYSVQPSVAKDIANQLSAGEIKVFPLANTQNKLKSKYSLGPITFVLLILYAVSYSLTKKKMISLVVHRKLWNTLLLLTFLVSGLLGLLLVVRINYGLTIPLPFNILYVHVQAGIAMAIISIFHILWHLNYFKSLFRPK